MIDHNALRERHDNTALPMTEEECKRLLNWLGDEEFQDHFGSASKAMKQSGATNLKASVFERPDYPGKKQFYVTGVDSDNDIIEWGVLIDAH